MTRNDRSSARCRSQRVEEVTDEPLYRDRVWGIDIGKAGLVATIRVPSDGNPARRMQETRSFGTTNKEVLDKNLLGRYAFAPPAGPELRPLRDPASPGNDQ